MNIKKLLSERPGAVEQVREEMRQLLTRSATDAAFRRRLIEDPIGTIEEFTGRRVPPGFAVEFVEGNADATIVLPKSVIVSDELNDAELDTISGGVTPPVLSSAAALILISTLMGVPTGAMPEA